MDSLPKYTKRHINTLENIVTRKGSGKVLTFSSPHVLKSIFHLYDERYVSRASLCREIRLGEGAVKTLIRHLKEFGMVDTIRAGTFLTEKGRKFADQFLKAVPHQASLEKCKATRGRHNHTAIIKKRFVQNLGNGMEQRDFAILYGASDSLTLIFEKGRFLFAGDEVQCFAGEPDVQRFLVKELSPDEGDAIIITSSDDRFVAEISAIGTVLGTLAGK